MPESYFLARLVAQLGGKSQRLVDRDGLVLALHLYAIDLAEHHVLYRIARRFTDQDADPIALGAPFQPGSDVHRIAHGGVGAPELRAHVAHAHDAGVHADADLERGPAAGSEARVQRLALALHRERREHGVARVLRVVHRRAPERHDRVADVFVERAAVGAADHRAHLGQVLVDVVAQLLGLERLGDAGKAAHVRKQYGELGAARRHAVLPRVGGHAVDELGRYVLAEAPGELLLGARL